MAEMFKSFSPNMREKAMDIIQSEEKSFQFLLKAGIITEEGKLHPDYSKGFEDKLSFVSKQIRDDRIVQLSDEVPTTLKDWKWFKRFFGNNDWA